VRVAIVNLTGGGLSGGGLKTMLHLVPRLRQDPRVEAMEVFVPRRVAELPALQGQPLRAWPDRDFLRGRRWLRTEVASFRPDVVYIPNAWWVRFGTTPTVVMVRNMEPLLQPTRGLPPAHALRNLARRHLARQACRRADRVIAVSGYVRDFLVGRWRVPEEKIGVVHHGVAPPPPGEQTCLPAALRGREHEPFIFTAGSLVAHRGLEDLIRCLPLLAGAAAPRNLAVAGQAFRSTGGYARRLLRLARRSGVIGRVCWLGQLTAAEMSWCYRNCDAVVITSRIEACPNVALESLSHGCLVVAASVPPMPEILDDAAAYYAPGDAEELARRLGALAGGAEMNEAMRSAARRRAGRFSWSAAASGTVAQLALAAESVAR
jgi:glycosyltransferase involved in cell wall biosynthesis